MRPLAALALFLFSVLPVFAQQTTLNLSVRTDNPATVPVGRQAGFLLELFNAGPVAAANVRLTLEVPDDVTVESIPELYGCDLAARPVRCFAGNIEPLGVRPYRIFVLGPQREGSFTLNATFESDNAPPVQAALTFVNRFEANLVASIELPRRGNPGTPLIFQTALANYVSELPARNVRITYVMSNARISHVEAHPSWSCTVDGSTAQCVTPVFDASCEECIVLRVHGVMEGTNHEGRIIELTMVVSSDFHEQLPENNVAQSRIELYRQIDVTNTADAGPGSLRNAIEAANASCDEIPCLISFNIPPPVPAEGWFTIIPSAPLPPITAANVVLDGTTQTRFTGDTNTRGPEIALDGRLAGRGLEMHAACEGVVQGLAIGNFMENQGLWYENPWRVCNIPITPERRLVSGNYIGTDPTGTVAWPNLRGLRADFAMFATVRENVISGNRFSGVWMWVGKTKFERNRIGTTADGSAPLPNGASGLYLGLAAEADLHLNDISFNREMGVAIARGPQDVWLAGNSMRGNGGLGIDWGLDGVSPAGESDRSTPTNAPVLLSSRYDFETQRTLLYVSWKTGPMESFIGHAYRLEVFANDSPDGDGEQPLASFDVQPAQIDGRHFEVAIPGDHKGKWLNATGTRWNFIYFSRPPGSTKTDDAFTSDVHRTSELSNAVQVQ